MNPTYVSCVDQINLLDVTADVDWLTITTKTNKGRERLFTEAAAILETIRPNAIVKKWAFRGYAGWICESARWGTRPDSDIMVVSGHDAHATWRRLLPLAENVSRLDLACTCKLFYPWPKLAKICFDFVMGIIDFKERRLYSHVENSRIGDTLYIGSRSSPQFGRFYDKGVESKTAAPGHIWRYEIEFKEHRARALGKELQKILGENPEWNTLLLPAMIAKTVRLWYRSRGVETLYTIEAKPLLSDISARITSDDIILEWLSTQVAPSVQGLVDREKTDAVLIALGLDWLLQGAAAPEVAEV